MLTYPITYTDYNGKTCTEDFMFNLTRVEATEMDVSYKGGLRQHIEELVENDDNKGLFDLFKEIILKAYGVKTPDGKRFIKSAQMSEEFSQTAAYSELIMKLTSDPEVTTAFINKVIPQIPASDAGKDNAVPVNSADA